MSVVVLVLLWLASVLVVPVAVVPVVSLVVLPAGVVVPVVVPAGLVVPVVPVVPIVSGEFVPVLVVPVLVPVAVVPVVFVVDVDWATATEPIKVAAATLAMNIDRFMPSSCCRNSRNPALRNSFLSLTQVRIVNSSTA
jgi:hypothetical protein